MVENSRRTVSTSGVTHGRIKLIKQIITECMEYKVLFIFLKFTTLDKTLQIGIAFT